jgi:hydroxymethylglutaryl-CoA lyase
MPGEVVICECFARDGLQHEDQAVSTADKVAAIDSLTAAGFPRIEATSYSHPDQVPAFRDASDVLRAIERGPGVHYKATCPNGRAVARAIADLEAGHGATELSLLVSAGEGHTDHNLRTTRAAQWQNVAGMAKAAAGRFRLVGVISVAFGCPIDGAVDPGGVVADAARFVAMGAALVALGDTTGLATPASVRSLFGRILAEVPGSIPVAHFHNSRGSGISNCVAAYDAGCRYFDSSFGGVGGHPYQIQYGSGLIGNVATEDLVNLFEALGISTGLDLERVMESSRLCERVLGRPLHSMVARAGYGALPQKEMLHA